MDSQINSFGDMNHRLFEIFKKDDFYFGIGDISNYSKLPQSKLRYWEKCGYIKSMDCNKNQNRKYSYKTLMKVLVIKSYLESGFTLSAAAKKAETFSKYQSIVHHMLKSRVTGIGTIDGKAAVNMGPLSKDPTKSIYFVEDENGINAFIKSNQ
ncbi:MerR family transcriptional regulator [Nicoliella lavandulae]|uniref:MerR family transcriptional regulator n=1 Tax=Nicoliella lavandulae TaxID=3082954 RepID=A0ABU8SJP7_9LACO